MKKIILTVLVFSVFIFNVNSLNPSDIDVVYMGRIYSREIFDSVCSNTSSMQMLFIEGSRGLLQPSRFFRIDRQQEDAEDRDMIDYVFNQSGKILRVYQTGADDDTYVIRVMRGLSTLDGWFILAQPNKTRGNWTYYLYYWKL